MKLRSICITQSENPQAVFDADSPAGLVLLVTTSQPCWHEDSHMTSGCAGGEVLVACSSRGPVAGPGCTEFGTVKKFWLEHRNHLAVGND